MTLARSAGFESSWSVPRTRSLIGLSILSVVPAEEVLGSVNPNSVPTLFDVLPLEERSLWYLHKRGMLGSAKVEFESMDLRGSCAGWH